MKLATTTGALASGVACGIGVVFLSSVPFLPLALPFVSLFVFVVDLAKVRALIQKHGFIGMGFTRDYWLDAVPSSMKRLLIFVVSFFSTASLLSALLKR